MATAESIEHYILYDVVTPLLILPNPPAIDKVKRGSVEPCAGGSSAAGSPNWLKGVQTGMQYFWGGSFAQRIRWDLLGWRSAISDRPED